MILKEKNKKIPWLFCGHRQVSRLNLHLGGNFWVHSIAAKKKTFLVFLYCVSHKNILWNRKSKNIDKWPTQKQLFTTQMMSNYCLPVCKMALIPSKYFINPKNHSKQWFWGFIEHLHEIKTIPNSITYNINSQNNDCLSSMLLIAIFYKKTPIFHKETLNKLLWRIIHISQKKRWCIFTVLLVKKLFEFKISICWLCKWAFEILKQGCRIFRNFV